MLTNRKAIEKSRISNKEEKEIARVRLIEEITSDGSKVYDVETAFYGKKVSPVLELVDTSPIDIQDAYKKFRSIVSALSVLVDSELA